jgi:hypothetical protein
MFDAEQSASYGRWGRISIFRSVVLVCMVFSCFQPYCAGKMAGNSICGTKTIRPSMHSNFNTHTHTHTHTHLHTLSITQSLAPTHYSNDSFQSTPYSNIRASRVMSSSTAGSRMSAAHDYPRILLYVLASPVSLAFLCS